MKVLILYSLNLRYLTYDDIEKVYSNVTYVRWLLTILIKTAEILSVFNLDAFIIGVRLGTRITIVFSCSKDIQFKHSSQLSKAWLKKRIEYDGSIRFILNSRYYSLVIYLWYSLLGLSGIVIWIAPHSKRGSR